jgi:hypothetical protein
MFLNKETHMLAKCCTMPFHKIFTISDMDSNSTRTENIWGLMFGTGIANKPTLKHYWYEDLVFQNSGLEVF